MFTWNQASSVSLPVPLSVDASFFKASLMLRYLYQSFLIFRLQCFLFLEQYGLSRRTAFFIDFVLILVLVLLFLLLLVKCDIPAHCGPPGPFVPFIDDMGSDDHSTLVSISGSYDLQTGNIWKEYVSSACVDELNLDYGDVPDYSVQGLGEDSMVPGPSGQPCAGAGKFPDLPTFTRYGGGDCLSPSSGCSSLPSDLTLSECGGVRGDVAMPLNNSPVVSRGCSLPSWFPGCCKVLSIVVVVTVLSAGVGAAGFCVGTEGFCDLFS